MKRVGYLNGLFILLLAGTSQAQSRDSLDLAPDMIHQSYCEKLKFKFDTLTQYYGTLQRENVGLANRLAGVTLERDNLSAEVEALNDMLTNEHTLATDLQAEKIALQNQNAALAIKVLEESNKNGELQQSVNGYTSKIISLNASLAELKASLAKAKTQSNIAKNALTGRPEALSAKKALREIKRTIKKIELLNQATTQN